MPFERRLIPAIAITMIDVFAIGFGMGVPVFAILLGFPVGWWLVRRRSAALPVGEEIPRTTIRALLGQAAALVGVTFAVLLVVWGPHIPKAFDPAFEAADWGIPLILYTSRPSIIGWLLLMLVISPALQYMALLAGAVLGLAAKPKESSSSREA